MHPVFPIMVWIGWLIYSFFVRILSPQFFTHTQQILYLKNTPHSRRINMLQNNFLTYPWLTKIGRFTIMPHNIIIKLLCKRSIFFPCLLYTSDAADDLTRV